MAVVADPSARFLRWGTWISDSSQMAEQMRFTREMICYLGCSYFGFLPSHYRYKDRLYNGQIGKGSSKVVSYHSRCTVSEIDMKIMLTLLALQYVFSQKYTKFFFKMKSCLNSFFITWINFDICIHLWNSTSGVTCIPITPKCLLTPFCRSLLVYRLTPGNHDLLLSVTID